MKKIGKPVFFIVFVLILALAYTSIFGVYGENGDFDVTYIKGINDIRWGIDINGGVEAVFAPADGIDADETQMEDVKGILDSRLVGQNITDYEVYPDYEHDRITIRFPWKSDEKDYDPDAAIAELASTSELSFKGGTESSGEVLLTGKDVKRAYATYQQGNTSSAAQYVVGLEFNDEGKEKFKTATSNYVGQQISIWMDDELLSAPTVNEAIDSGSAVITGNFTSKSATALANKINAGALPFKLVVESYGTISPSLGSNALQAMGISAIVALALICAFMLIMYRLPGFIASCLFL